MSADFSKLLAHLQDNLEEHARRDELNEVRTAIFLTRGGHAPGEVCPSAPKRDPHDPWCEFPDDECTCHLRGHDPAGELKENT